MSGSLPGEARNEGALGVHEHHSVADQTNAAVRGDGSNERRS